MVTLVDGDLYQWDTGRVVLIDPRMENEVKEVHFTNRKIDFAYVAKTYSKNGNTYCAIPNILLQQYYDIYCYEVRYNDDGEESVSTTIFSVIKRSRPLDYVYTEPEKYTYKQLEERIEKLEASFEEVKTAADEASVLANEAYTMAESAQATASSFSEKIEDLQSQIESSSGGSHPVVEF